MSRRKRIFAVLALSAVNAERSVASTYVTWIGETAEPARLLEHVTAHLAREYEQPATLWRTRERPQDSFDERRRQHSSRVVLEWLAARLPDPHAKVIGVTDVDLFIPVLTFVFGEAQLGGQAAVVSTARLRQPDLEGVFRERLLKEAAHELGHTFGLVHCTSPSCVMARSPSIVFVDVKTERLCDACRVRLRERKSERVNVRT